MESLAKSDALSIIEWCHPCSASHFPGSCVVYQHQYLGLHLDQMVEPTSNPATDLTMVNIWLPRYARE